MVYNNVYLYIQWVNRVFLYISVIYLNDNWVSERAVPTTLNVQLAKINDRVGRIITGVECLLGTDKIKHVDENKLRYPIEHLNFIPGNASIPDH